MHPKVTHYVRTTVSLFTCIEYICICACHTQYSTIECGDLSIVVWLLPMLWWYLKGLHVAFGPGASVLD